MTIPEGFFVPEGTVYRRIIYTPAAILTANISQVIPGGPWHVTVEVSGQLGFPTAESAAAFVNRLVSKGAT